jgi:hypothetical protein
MAFGEVETGSIVMLSQVRILISRDLVLQPWRPLMLALGALRLSLGIALSVTELC